jgi:threonine dehydratase
MRRTPARYSFSPYNDGPIIAGQGTTALEIVRQLRHDFSSSADIAAWYFPVGGGGLIAVRRGAGRAAGTRLISIQPAASAFTHSLFHHNTRRCVG